jgi:hypothetical protein
MGIEKIVHTEPSAGPDDNGHYRARCNSWISTLSPSFFLSVFTKRDENDMSLTHLPSTESTSSLAHMTNVATLYGCVAKCDETPSCTAGDYKESSGSCRILNIVQPGMILVEARLAMASIRVGGLLVGGAALLLI